MHMACVNIHTVLVHTYGIICACNVFKKGLVKGIQHYIFVSDVLKHTCTVLEYYQYNG